MRDAYDQITAEGFAVLGVSIETGLNNIRLAEYVDGHDFQWQFTVGSQEFLNAVVEQYGSRAIVTTNAPGFIVSSDGTLGPLLTGVKSGAEILAALRAAG